VVEEERHHLLSKTHEAIRRRREEASTILLLHGTSIVTCIHPAGETYSDADTDTPLRLGTLPQGPRRFLL